MRIYRSTKSCLDQDRIDLIGGFSLVREEDSKNEDKAMTTEDIISEEQILGVHDFERRESAIESFLYQKISIFFQEMEGASSSKKNDSGRSKSGESTS